MILQQQYIHAMYRKYNLLTAFTGQLRFVPSVSEITLTCEASTHCFSSLPRNLETFRLFQKSNEVENAKNVKLNAIFSYLRINRFNCKWNARLDRKCLETNGLPSKVFHKKFFRSIRLEQKFPFHLRNSVSASRWRLGPGIFSAISNVCR